MNDVYRRMTMLPSPKSEYVQISRDVSLRRDWIAEVLEDGTVVRKDGFREKGDPARLHEEGLL